MGVSVENEEVVSRIDSLRKTHAYIKFLSLEPLLGPLPRLKLKGIDWAIVGGESGPHARSMNKEWVIDIRNQCRKAEVAFFFKQWGGFSKKKTGRLLEGKTWSEMPLGGRISDKRPHLIATENGSMKKRMEADNREVVPAVGR
jgi:protein gp37